MKQNIKNLPKIGQIIYTEDNDGDSQRHVILPSYFCLNHSEHEYTLWRIRDDNYTMLKYGSGTSIEETLDLLPLGRKHRIFIGAITTCDIFNNPRFIND